jgi:uncharacterized protein (DUF983 family)
LSEHEPTRPVDIPVATGRRLRVTLLRALARRCPYCGSRGIFSSWFALKERCPACRTLFAYEDGYFLGAYALNLVVTEFVAVGLTLWLLATTDLSVLQLQITGVTLAVALPIAFYPVAVCLWMVLDLVFHPPTEGSGRPRR